MTEELEAWLFKAVGGVSTERREKTEKKAEEQHGGEMIRPRTLHVTFRGLAS